jgi:predicted dehydrogenase
MDKRRVGIIGLGMASAPHARSLIDLKDRVEVAACYSPTAARRESFAESYGFPVVDDAEAIFTDPSITAVLILTPPSTHLELAERAARSGQHMLLEKPLDITPERSRAIVTIATEANITLGIVFQNRFRPAALALRDLMASGRLGKIVGASARLQNWRPQSYYDAPGRGTLARDGGGVLLTQAIHTIDLLTSFVGLPSQVFASATTTPLHEMETEDLVSATLIFDNGAIGTLHATTSAYPGYPERIELIGTGGTIVFEGEKLVVNFIDGTVSVVDGAQAGTGTGADPMAFSHGMHRALITDFLDAIDNGTQPRATGKDALMAHVLIEAMLRSSSSHALERVEL